MNEIEKMESLLRKAPRLNVPTGLREALQAQIVLPHVQAREPIARDWRPTLKRWLPALSFAAFFLACLAAIAVQTSILLDLRRENENLKNSNRSLEQLRSVNLEYQNLRAENQELERLRKESAELERLRTEVVQLRAQVQELPSLQSEHERLSAEKKAAESRIPRNPAREDPFGAMKEKAQRIACINNIKMIVLAARLFAMDANFATDVKRGLSSDFASMTNNLTSPKSLICPGDTNRLAALNWSELGPANVSYELISPGAIEDPSVVYLRCRIHNNVGLANGSAQMLGSDSKIVKKDGKWVIEKAAPKPNPFE
jgi:predicted transcriptional regulator